jgi:hypothetical protein
VAAKDVVVRQASSKIGRMGAIYLPG